MSIVDSALEAQTLCGHDDAPRFTDLQGESAICQPCYQLARSARDEYLSGAAGYRLTRARLLPLLGREARAYCRALRWARLRTRLHLVR